MKPSLVTSNNPDDPVHQFQVLLELVESARLGIISSTTLKVKQWFEWAIDFQQVTTFVFDYSPPLPDKTPL